MSEPFTPFAGWIPNDNERKQYLKKRQRQSKLARFLAKKTKR